MAVPCSLLSSCDEEQEQVSAQSGLNKDCRNCSPFSNCATAHSLVNNNIQTVSLDLLMLISQFDYKDPSSFTPSDYSSCYWQPPRFG